MELIFGAMLVGGLLYLLLMIVGGIGETLDVDIEGAVKGTGIDAVLGLDSPDSSEISGLGCSVIAAFMAGFGAVGLVGSLSGWPVLIMLGVALVFGLLMGRAVSAALRFVYAQQSTSVYSNDEMIGLSARVTINSAPGKTGEAIIESGQVLKYPVKEVSGAELKRGDTVQVVDVQGQVLLVKKKRGE